VQFDREKFKLLVHYVCWRCIDNPSALGSVKLNKILWASDFTAYYQGGQSITGAGYVKRQYGPVPRAIVPILKELEADGAVVARDRSFHGFTKKEFVVKCAPDMSGFSQADLAIVDQAITLICDQHTARSISAQSHDHIWRAASDGEDIPYYTIFAVQGEISPDELDWAKQELETLGA
jgi:hypothetical protein